MWCIGKITAEYRQRMYDLLELYARHYREEELVVCVDEKSKQFLQQTRTPIAVEPKGGHRQAEVTARSTKPDFVRFIGRLVEKVYAGAQKIHLVMDNLNTHFRSSFVEVLGVKRAEQMLERVEFHYTPKHASRLNMAEIEIGVMDRQCIGGRLASEAMLKSEVATWKRRRNQAQTRIEWKFTRQDADHKLSRHYVS